MGIKLEVYNDEWYEIKLKKSQKPKINVTGGSIKSPSTRKITHSNSFTLPLIETNLRALGLNQYNVNQLVSATNSKYPSRISSDLGLVSEGYLLVNRIDDDGIVVNTFTTDLGLLDQWGADSLIEAFSGAPSETTPTDFITKINQLRSYTITPTSLPLTQLTDMPAGYPVAYFPTNLNKIGEKFSKNTDDSRYEDAINSYQTRPIFNCRALIELAAYKYGYEPVFSDNIDTDQIESEFVTGEGTASYKDGTAVNKQRIATTNILTERDGNTQADYIVTGFKSEGALAPIDFNAQGQNYDWSNFATTAGLKDIGFIAHACLFPFKGDNFLGNIEVSMRHSGAVAGTNTKAVVMGAWSSSVDDNVKGVSITTTPVVDSEISGTISFSADKADFIEPANAETFLGFCVFMINTTAVISAGAGTFSNCTLDEEYTSEQGGVYDEDDQYIEGVTNLMVELPNMTVKTFISRMLERHGMKMQINEADKQILFYNYADTIAKAKLGEIRDWSSYKIRTKSKTTYLGSEYGSRNIISLSNPIRGNQFEKQLLDQGSSSRYDPVKEAPISALNDIEETNIIPEMVTNAGTSEVTLKKIGLVTVDGGLSSIHQCRVDDLKVTSYINDVPNVKQVDFNSLPAGVHLWYDVAAKSVVEEALFLLPQWAIKNVDLITPIYIDGNLYILDEIQEYEDEQTLCILKLIQIGSDVLNLI